MAIELFIVIGKFMLCCSILWAIGTVILFVIEEIQYQWDIIKQKWKAYMDKIKNKDKDKES